MTASLRQALRDAGMALRFARDLPGYLREPLDPQRAAAIVRERLHARERTLVRFARQAIFAQPSSPYRALLAAAGCTAGDFEKLVDADGVEGALQVLCRAGVFVTVDELKGRKPIVRGSFVRHVNPTEFRNAIAQPHLASATGGSRGAPMPVALDLACIRERAVNMYLALLARGGERWRNAVWGLRGMIPVLWYSAAEPRAARWFTQIDANGRDTPRRFRWAIRLYAWGSARSGHALPRPEHAPLDNPTRLLRWLAETLAGGAVPHVWSSPSAVVRLCEAARDSGTGIAGAQFTLTGEPITAARIAVTRAAGTTALADYGSVDSGGTVAYGCLHGEAPDDVHVFTDLNALIAASTPTLPSDALLITSLSPTAPFVLLNASMGDRATLRERRCGCPMEAHGWTTHLAHIRSFEKLTAGGVTFDDAKVVTILEESLPARFGGGPTDYQLVEEARDDGRARLRLLVHPAIGALDAGAVRDAFLAALGGGRDIDHDMAEQWRVMDTVEVCREAPRVSRTGKILHLVAGERP